MFKPYSNYHKSLKNEIEKIAKNPKAIFIGQQVQSESFYGLLDNIALDKRTEMPVAEELQLGMSIGLAMEGYLPFSIYQRMDFYLLKYFSHIFLKKGKVRVDRRNPIEGTIAFNQGLSILIARK